MLSQRLFDEVSSKLSEVLASSPARDIEKNMKAVLSAAFAKLDLVTREEFEVQQEVLARTREKLGDMEKRLAALEGRVDTTPQAVQNPQDEL
ncbi:accessory factor UbiK family protein [Parachitinimonas caeni]|uniref:Ubiquinone biosynthesis accessory factor UbiK n=1 Tax=Parachitinimonas caeni TaxID=3031301 RepID=A0ABT7DRL9_9NEIS|nr:accessory factor UbiK family protein [Parachitinimonas caeni]MDK2122696.1 accessory factor UbiK family protein [Parachitinimonas caeni]